MFTGSPPLSVHFFLKPHLLALLHYFYVALACNPKNDAYLPSLDLPVHQVAVGIVLKISSLRDLITLVELYRLFKREHFGLFVSVAPKAGLLGMLAAKLAGVPCRVHISQGEVWALRHGLLRILPKMMDRITAHVAHHMLAMGPGERRFLEEEVMRPDQVRVLGSGSIAGVNLDRFRPNTETRSNLRKTRRIPNDALMCLFLGRFTVDKGVFELVPAFALSSENNAKLWLVLAGPDEEGLGKLLRSTLKDETAQRMIVEGFTHTPERYLAAADRTNDALRHLRLPAGRHSRQSRPGGHECQPGHAGAFARSSGRRVCLALARPFEAQGRRDEVAVASGAISARAARPDRSPENGFRRASRELAARPPAGLGGKSSR